MKLIFLSMLMAFNFCEGQDTIKTKITIVRWKPDTTKLTPTRLAIATDFNSMMIMTLPDSTIYIEGDTTAIMRGIFKMMWNESHRQDSVQQVLRKALQSAVNVTNGLPNEQKAGKKWRAYQRQLRKVGYKSYTVPPLLKRSDIPEIQFEHS